MQLFRCWYTTPGTGYFRIEAVGDTITFSHKDWLIGTSLEALRKTNRIEEIPPLVETFKYRFLTRPASSFNCPMNNFVAFHEESKFRKHGIVEYSAPLSIKDATHFDLAPLFLASQYSGKKVNFFDDLIGEISYLENLAGQLFFVVTYDEDPTYIVWHQFVKHIESGRYKII